MSKNQIIFFTVRAAAEKIQILQDILQKHLQNKENIKILVPDFKTVEFLSNLLWTHPPESFIPHSTSLPISLQDRILITTPPLVEDGYPFIFNLTPLPITLFPEIKVLYELEDLSISSKTAIFQEKLTFYKNKNYIISAGSKT